jgi:hypothetical protein
MKKIVAFAMAVILSGCGGNGFLNTNKPEDAGASPIRYEETIKSYLNNTLKDPYSIRDLSISRPHLSACSIGVYGNFNAWVVHVSYNAKNSYGAYVGLQTSYFWFHGDHLKGVNVNPTFCPEAAGWIY